MKKIIFTICSVILFAVIIVVYSFQTIFNKSENLHREAVERADIDFEFNKVINTSTFNGKEQYIAIEALKKNKKKIFILVPVNGEVLFAYRSTQGISKSKAIELVKSKADVKKVIKVQLGMEDEIPLWEVTYINEKGNYSYYYLSFEDGAFIKRYSL